MKTKLIAGFLLAGSCLFAAPRIAIGEWEWECLYRRLFLLTDTMRRRRLMSLRLTYRLHRVRATCG